MLTFGSTKRLPISELVKFKNAFSTDLKLHVVLGQFDTPKRIYYSISSQFKPFFKKYMDLFKKLIEQEELLDGIGNALPNWTCWDSYKIPSPILVIDEANMFSQLFLLIPHATPYVVGDLSKKEAKEYFKKPGSHDGTRMLIIDRYVKEYQNYDGKFEHSNFSIYGSEYDKLKHGLYPKILRYSDKPNLPLWKGYDLIKTMKAIVKSEDQGYILEDDLIKAIGPKQVNSLVDYNFLHCRPTTLFANDIDPPDKIILTAMNQPSVRTMEQVLSEVTSNKK
ncbi:15061_t:CDS:2 [Funneliformis geosporum]|uniref:15061_t:CDS:1 n=1 Tax=Funneliformis geosporum TaxID=1117311 RepID=A0A9W4SDJ2_9GLOM|nr:15061_t:CDS:2 [Funneliformis geosporum]